MAVKDPRDIVQTDGTYGDNLPPIHRAANNLNWTERTMCSALEDMRKTSERHEVLLDTHVDDDITKNTLTRPIWVIRSLIEEIQVYGNRMEAALEDQKSYRKLKEEHKKLKEEVEKLKKEKETLSDDEGKTKNAGNTSCLC